MINSFPWPDRLRCLMLASMIGILAGCARDQYFYGIQAHGTLQQTPCEWETINPIAVGGEHPTIDKLENFVQGPKNFFLRLRADHDRELFSPEQLRQQAIGLTQQYLAENGLHDVCIDARRYEPIEQWQRLKANDRVAPLWKYTAGTLDVIGYTLLPKRALHADVYSPFTNTLSINSTEPTKALYQAARAKEYRKQRWLGTYAVMQRAPVAGLIHHANAATDVLTYAQVNQRSELTRELYSCTYSELGTAAVSDALFMVPLSTDAPTMATPVARLMGRATGRWMGKLVLKREEKKALAEQPAADESKSASVSVTGKSIRRFPPP